jgi:hypothetical protein
MCRTNKVLVENKNNVILLPVDAFVAYEFNRKKKISKIIKMQLYIVLLSTLHE